MSNIYLEKIAKRVSRARKLYDDGKEVYDEAKDTLEVKKKLMKKNTKARGTLQVQGQNPVTKKRMSVSGRKWNRGPVPKKKAK